MRLNVVYRPCECELRLVIVLLSAQPMLLLSHISVTFQIMVYANFFRLGKTFFLFFFIVLLCTFFFGYFTKRFKVEYTTPRYTKLDCTAPQHNTQRYTTTPLTFSFQTTSHNQTIFHHLDIEPVGTLRSSASSVVLMRPREKELSMAAGFWALFHVFVLVATGSYPFHHCRLS